MCKASCKLCDKLVISSAVTFTAGTGLIIDLPAGTYADDNKYCIVVSQTIPAATTITAPVYISIGGVVTTLYPLQDPCGRQVTACGIRTRTRYATKVHTTTTGGVFRLMSGTFCYPQNNLPSLPVPTT